MYSLSEIECKDSKIQLIMQTKGITISVKAQSFKCKDANSKQTSA